MKYVNFPGTEEKVSVLGLGTWVFGGENWGGADDEDCVAAVHEALALGINFIDTAPFYTEGKAEELIGRAIKGQREKAFIATKCGIVRENGLEEVLRSVRDTIPEGDQFILESLETGRGSLSALVFLEDLRTIAPGDRQRMLVNYVVFLVFLAQRVLRQYLQPLEGNQARLRDVSRRLDHLITGVRDSLLAQVNARS